jgi:glutathione S-transferase
MQDKGATAERNPLRFVPALRREHVLAPKIDRSSTDRGGAPLTESRPLGFGRTCWRAQPPRGKVALLNREARTMRLYDGGRAPNPRRVRIFLAEKGIKVPAEQLDLGALQQRSEAYTAINPMQRVPALVLDDGTVIAESIAICRYFEAVQPDPPLFGVGALQSALVEMWNRRAELHLLFPVASVFQHLHPAMSRMVDPQVPQWGEANKPRVMQFLEFLDRELKDRAHVAGANYTVADITALVAVDFMRVSKMALPEGLSNLQRWHKAVSARPSAAA